jgi:hypothetical protein
VLFFAEQHAGEWEWEQCAAQCPCPCLCPFFILHSSFFILNQGVALLPFPLPTMSGEHSCLAIVELTWTVAVVCCVFVHSQVPQMTWTVAVCCVFVHSQVPRPTIETYDGDHGHACETCADTGTLVCCFACSCVAHQLCDLFFSQCKSLPDEWQCQWQLECVCAEKEILESS